MQQGNGGITGPNVATPGSTITVKVQNGEKTVTVTGGGKMKEYPVVNGEATVEVPPDVPGGQSFWVFASRGKDTSYLRVEVIEI